VQDDFPTAPEALQAPLRRLDLLGLCRPDHLTLQRYMEILCNEGMATPVTTRAFVTLYQEAAFGGGQIDEQSTSEVAARLEDEITRGCDDSTLVERLAHRLRPLSPVEPEHPVGLEEALTKDNGGPLSSLPADEPPDEADSPDVAPGMWRRPFTRRSILATALILWSLAMIALGFWKHESISRSITRFQIRVLRRPWLVPAEVRLQRLRHRAAALPGVTAVWADYANTAAAQHRYAEAVLAYRHLIARDPDNAELLNDLAWMLCTAEDAVARDPVQALELAELAYALDPGPHITDTLAEAAFQNGDAARAVALEEEALAKIGGDAGFYRQQLEKFRAGLGEGE